MADLSFRVQQVIKNEIDVTQAQLSRNGITLLSGIGQLRRPAHDQGRRPTRRVGATRPTSFIIATGTMPAESPNVPVNGRTVLLSDQVMQMPQLPKTLIVVGGGVIGVEYAWMFAALGVRVVLVEKRPRLLEFADQEIVEALCYHLRDHRVTLRLGEEVASVEESDGAVDRDAPEPEEDLGRRAALRRRPERQRRRAQSGRRRPRGRRARTHPGRRGVPDEAAAHLRRRRRDRLPQPGVGVDGTGPARRRPRGRHAGSVEPGSVSLRHLHDSGDLVHREDRGAAHGRRRAVRDRARLLPRDRARADPRRHDRPPEADLPPRDEGAARRAHHRRGRRRAGAHRPGGAGAQRARWSTS